MVAGLVAAVAAGPVVAHAADDPARPDTGGVRVTGAVRHPGELSRAKLAALPQKTMTVTYHTAHGEQTRTESGPLLSDVVPATALAATTAKNDQLAFAMLAVGADGYAAAIAYGEVAPHITHQSVILALTQDGKPLATPRLIVPADLAGGRDIRDLVEIHVVRLTA
jgi:DMSO/TMAO reductase YedYZ molybdopterin-dependent catalytic subunit